MSRDPNIWTRIISDYRAGAHVVEGVGLLLARVWFGFLVGLDIAGIISIVYGIFETVKGCILLKGIVGEKKRLVLLYLILSGITLVVKKGFAIYLLVWVLSVTTRGIIFGTCVFFILGVYFTYEWFTFYFVHCLYRLLLKRNFETDPSMTASNTNELLYNPQEILEGPL